MPVQKSHCTAPVVPRVWPAPVWIISAHTPHVWRIVTGIVQDPATRFFRSRCRHTVEWIGRVNWLASRVGDIGQTGRPGHNSPNARPLRVRPRREITPADTKVYPVVRH